MNQTLSPPRLSADQVDWLMVTANCMLTQKYPERALTLLEFLLCYEPANQPARQMAGYCYHLLGRDEEALNSFKALDAGFRGANPIGMLLNAKALAALGRTDEALNAFNEFRKTPYGDL